MDLKTQIDPSTVIVGALNTPLSPIGRSSRQKINKEISEKVHLLDQMDIVDIYIVFHPTSMQYTFFSASHGTLFKIDYILGHIASLNKFKKIEITPCIISDDNVINPELNKKGNHRRYTNTWRLNNTLLDDLWVTKEIREELKKFLESTENENTPYQNLGDTKNIMLREKFIAISAYIKKPDFSNKQLKIYLKLPGKQEQTKPKISRQRGLIKLRAQINEIETRPLDEFFL
jgi:hypothetical protein